MSSFFEISYCDQIKHVEVVDKIPQSGGTLPSTITFDGIGCKNYTFSANCQWDMTSTSPNITVTPSTGAANVLYDISVCYIGEGNKVVVTDLSGNTYSIPCDDTNTLNWEYYEYQKTSISGGYRNITEAVIGDCVQVLSASCFQDCRNLDCSSISGATGLREIEMAAYENTHVYRNRQQIYGGTLNLPNGLQKVGSRAFGYTGFNNLNIPASLTDIAHGYGGTNNYMIRHPFVGMTALGTYEYEEYSGLTYSITVDTGNTVYDSRNNCNAIMETATDTLIFGCPNTVIPDETKIIGVYAFVGGAEYSGKTITIPSSVTEIQVSAFEGCILDSVTILATTPPIMRGSNYTGTTGNNYAFYAGYGVTPYPIYVPSESVETYKAADGWTYYADRITAIPNS